MSLLREWISNQMGTAMPMVTLSDGNDSCRSDILEMWCEVFSHLGFEKRRQTRKRNCAARVKDSASVSCRLFDTRVLVATSALPMTDRWIKPPNSHQNIGWAKTNATATTREGLRFRHPEPLSGRFCFTFLSQYQYKQVLDTSLGKQ